MAIIRRLTPKPQYRTMHRRADGSIYYTDRSPSYSKKDTKSGKDPNAHLKEKKVPKPSAKMLWEARNYGIQFVQQKYKLSSAMVKAIRTSNKADGRAGAESVAKNALVRIGNKLVRRDIGDSSLNAPPEAKDGYVARKGRFKDGPAAQAIANASPNARFLQLNLENDSGLAQGSHHPWAQSTSISSVITSQLRQAQNSPIDYWEQWAKDKGGKVDITNRDSSPFGVDVAYSSDVTNAGGSLVSQEQEIAPLGPMSSLANDNPMGAFGTNAVMDPEYSFEQEVDTEAGTEGTMHTMSVPNAGANGVYNPWSEGEGGQANAFGPSGATMAQATMEAMALANAYFAPQRMELAYQLGDMETDMRRLAVNLGRQVDDPVLQAKLYKEAMRSVRTLDVQQNTLAFQMAEQRRREELQNFQFYDSLAQQEYNIRKQNEQFYKRLELDNAYFGLKKDELNMLEAQSKQPAANSAPVPGTQNSPVTTPAAPTAPAPASQSAETLSSYDWSRLMGGGNLLSYK